MFDLPCNDINLLDEEGLNFEILARLPKKTRYGKPDD